MHFSIYTLFITLIFSSFTGLSQSKLEQAEQFFDKRSELVEDGKANSDNIDKALENFKQSNKEPERTIGLLKSYEYKASWTEVTQEQQKELYKKAIDLAAKKSDEYPNNGAIAYWHVANYARWGDLLEITEAAKEGVLDKIKKLSEKAIDLDQGYNQAGSLRLLGGIHLEAPNIPLILDWPSNDEAKRLLLTAYKIAPQHPANAYLYAKCLHVIGKERKSEKIFEDLIARKERDSYFLVDQKYLGKARQYYHENF